MHLLREEKNGVMSRLFIISREGTKPLQKWSIGVELDANEELAHCSVLQFSCFDFIFLHLHPQDTSADALEPLGFADEEKQIEAHEFLAHLAPGIAGPAKVIGSVNVSHYTCKKLVSNFGE